jgi:hypothetical protein
MPRRQFGFSTLLWLTLAVACWFGGMRFERWMVERREAEEGQSSQTGAIPLPLEVELEPLGLVDSVARESGLGEWRRPRQRRQDRAGFGSGDEPLIQEAQERRPTSGSAAQEPGTGR